MLRARDWMGMIVGAAALGGCAECELLAAPLDAEIEVTNDLEEAFEVTVRATQAIYALGTEIAPGRCARWPVSPSEYFVEVSGDSPACLGESEPFEIADGDLHEVVLSSIPCE